MDPITTAIMAVLPNLAGDTLKAAVKDAYDGLKAVIHRKWGESSPISKAVVAIEGDPTSKTQAGVLAEKVEAVKATEDREVMQALQKLVDQMKANSIDDAAVARIHLAISGGTQQGIIGSTDVTGNTLNIGRG